MTDRERVKLLFGQYKAPALKRGDRAACLYRDCLVVITTWSSAPIPWPRYRALDVRGGSGLLVDEELARAVRHESAAAGMFWFGMGAKAVWAWRQALEVSRTDVGTARLVKAILG